jgi:hypothetical protein
MYTHANIKQLNLYLRQTESDGSRQTNCSFTGPCIRKGWNPLSINYADYQIN